VELFRLVAGSSVKTAVRPFPLFWCSTCLGLVDMSLRSSSSSAGVFTTLAKESACLLHAPLSIPSSNKLCALTFSEQMLPGLYRTSRCPAEEMVSRESAYVSNSDLHTTISGCQILSLSHEEYCCTYGELRRTLHPYLQAICFIIFELLPSKSRERGHVCEIQAATNHSI
jgi:hypothetical protein